jgi:hypothetical protein
VTARYLPPVRLYLAISLVFFLWASATHDKLKVLQVANPDSGPPRTVVTPLEGAFGTPLRGESAEQHAERVCSSGVPHARQARAAVLLLPGERLAHARARQRIQRIHIVKGEVDA